jgi:hypothetical protein
MPSNFLPFLDNFEIFKQPKSESLSKCHLQSATSNLCLTDLPGLSQSNQNGQRFSLQDLYLCCVSTDIIFKQQTSDCDRECYHREMSRANFCLCPLGWTPWTLRFYQAVMTRCIPVVVADDIEFPWENEIDYSKFAIKVPEAKVRKGERKHSYSNKRR